MVGIIILCNETTHTGSFLQLTVLLLFLFVVAIAIVTVMTSTLYNERTISEA